MLSACSGKSRPVAYWTGGTHSLSLGLVKKLPMTSLQALSLPAKVGSQSHFIPVYIIQGITTHTHLPPHIHIY